MTREARTPNAQQCPEQSAVPDCQLGDDPCPATTTTTATVPTTTTTTTSTTAVVTEGTNPGPIDGTDGDLPAWKWVQDGATMARDTAIDSLVPTVVPQQVCPSICCTRQGPPGS